MALDETGVYVKTPGRFAKMTEKVEQVTFSGKRARLNGQEVLYVSERGVMKLDEEGLLMTELMPGIDPEKDVIHASKGLVRVSENATLISTDLLKPETMGLKMEAA